MGRGVFVYGAGGHGKVVAEALLKAGRPVLGFVDDAVARHGQTHLGRPVVGGLDGLRERHPGAAVALAVGDNRVRALCFTRCVELGLEVVRVIHPSAQVSDFAEIGPGVVVLPLAVVNAGASLGRGAIVNTSAVVEHDCVVGEFAHVASRAVIQGGVRVGASATVGAGATVPYGVAVPDAVQIPSGRLYEGGQVPSLP